MNERDKKIIVKVVRVHPDSIEFRCAYEDSEYHIDDMPVYSYDLANFAEIDNMDRLLQEIGRSAWMIAARQDTIEHIRQRPINKLDLKSLVGKEIGLTLGEIYKSEDPLRGAILEIRSD